MKRLGLIGFALIGAAATASAQQQAAPGKQEVPAEYKPPKGMCRIWLKDVPAKQQPAPTDCAAAVKNVPQNGRVIFGDAAEAPKGKVEVPKDARGYSGKTTPPPPVIKKPPAR